MRLTAKLPSSLAALSVLAILVGAIGLVGAVALYAGYRPIEGDAEVAMNVPVTGVMVGLYFLTFIVFGVLIIKGKTFGHSGLVLTNVILADHRDCGEVRRIVAGGADGSAGASRSCPVLPPGFHELVQEQVPRTLEGLRLLVRYGVTRDSD